MISFRRPRRALLLALAIPLVAQNPPEKQLLRLSFQPGASRFYRMTVETETKVKAGDKELTVDTTMEQVLEMKCVEVKDGKALIDLTTQRLILKATAPVKVDYDSDVEGSSPGMLRNAVDMLGKTIAMRVDERGKLSDVEVPEAFAALGMFGSGGVEQMMSQALPQMPEGPVSIGDTWETRSEMTMGRYGSAELKIVNKVAALEKGSVRIDQAMEMEVDADSPSVGKFQPGKCAGSTVVDLATGSIRESSMDSGMSASGSTSMEMLMHTKLRTIDAPPAKSDAVKEPAKTETGKGK